MLLQNQRVMEPPPWRADRSFGGRVARFSGTAPGAVSEVARKANFSILRYAQCWEDTDVLLEALDIQPGDDCLSIASGGDNTLAMLAREPRRVIALDLSPAQLACLELRIAAYRELNHRELLEFHGSVPSVRRISFYRRCRRHLSEEARALWDARTAELSLGFGHLGKFERYLARFRSAVLPLIHSQRVIESLLEPRTADEREAFYRDVWDTWRWRLAFRLFFSRRAMGRWGRDHGFFQYANGNVAECLLQRARYAVTALDPSTNPYVQWILTGGHRTALPFALREENFEAIRRNLHRLEWRCQSLEDFLVADGGPIDCFNLSNVFEYMSPGNYRCLLERMARFSLRGARLAYWNLFARRECPAEMNALWRPLPELARRLHDQDKAFFYSRFVVEERR
jgi:S-adenosylmethionine-diacylglycerol 3-amino-3-carboxypropyl transferase